MRGVIELRKMLIALLIVFVFVLAACSNDTDEDVIEVNNEEAAVNESEAFTDRETLPFDTNEFNELYKSKYGEHIGSEEGTPLAVKEETIALLNGSMNETLILLYTLNDLTDGNEIGEYAEQFHSDLTNDTFYNDDTVLDGLEINISATDINSVSVSVFNEE